MENYNWWDDPKNKEQIEKISWWNHEENQDFFMLPLSVTESEGCWVACCNEETEKLLGKGLHAVAQGTTKEDAILKMFRLVKMLHEHSEDCRLNYQRWVPFRKGTWKHIGGKWFTVFGLHFYFRHGKNMKRGRYIPFTDLNISTSNEWKIYKNRRNKINPI